MSAESEQLERRKLAVQKALPRYEQLKIEEGTIRKKLNEKKASIKALLAGLENHGVGQKAFMEALKRSGQDQQELHLFDSETMELEEWMRTLESGHELVDENDTAAEVDFAEDEDGEEEIEVESAEDGPEGSDAKVMAEEPYRDPDFEEDPEPPHVVHQREQDAKVDASLAERAQRPRTARIRGGGKGNVVELPPADPQAAKKIQTAQPDAGTDGFSADDIPMPQTALHNLTPQQRADAQKKAQSGFVDRTERMSAQEANELLGTGTD